jgi:type VII secretion-associated serine protease mycosin
VLDAFDAESVWKVTKGKGETVAVIDDGVNAQHPDLKGNVLKGKDFVDGGSPAPAKGDDHGTGIAAMIAGHGHGAGQADGIMGLAPEVKILPIRDRGDDSDGLVDSIKYAVDHGASVINISLGGSIKNTDEAEAVTYALKKDVPIFASTGNSGKSVEYPAAYPGMVPVGGVNRDGTIWEKSNRGPKTLLTAPATRVLTAGGENSDYYVYGTGTSDSTAFASAAAALVRSKYPDLTAGQIVNRLTKTAEMPAAEKGAKLPDERYGYGAIRPLAALQKDIPKGSKYGPLSLPQQLKNEEKVAEKERESKAQQEQADKEFVILWTITGILALLFVGGIVLTIVLVRRRKRNRNNGPGGPGAPGAPGGYAGQVPHQQGPYAQPTAPPQQPPYN